VERKVPVELDVVTPAYAGAADPKKTEGLRPPTLKALVRFWWRAMHAHLGYEQLAAAEAKLFGSTDTGQGIIMRPRQGRPTGHVDPPGTSIGTECQWYTAYGAVAYVKGKGQLTDAERLQPGQTYAFDLLVPPTVKGEDLQPALQQVRNSLWLLSAFGGFGMRSRRGWGSLQAVGDLDGLPNLRACTTREDLIAGIQDGLKSVCPQPPDDVTEHTALTKQSVVLVGTAHATWEDAFKAVAGPYRELRRNLGAEYGHAKRGKPAGEDFQLMSDYRKPPSGPSGPEEPTQGSAFGLPHNYSFSDKTVLNVEVYGPDADLTDKKAHGSGRRASPVLFKVLKTSIEKTPFVPVVAWLPAHFLGEGYKLMLSKQVGPLWGKRPLERGANADRAIKTFLGNETVPMATDRGPEDFEGLQKRGWAQVVWS